MVSDAKKVQSLINLVAIEAQAIKDASVRLEALKLKFTTQNPVITGTPLEGNLTAVNTWLSDVKAVADAAVSDGMIAAYVPSHKGNALG